MSGQIRLARAIAILAFAGVGLAAQPASAVMLVELKVNASNRGFGPSAPIDQKAQDFSVPSGPGTLVMTYSESTYVGGPGGFLLTEKRLSNDALGFGGACAYTPRDPIKGQPYRVQCTWLRDFSRKNWTATLTARHDPPNRRQFAGVLTLNVEFIPGTPQDPAKAPTAAPAPASPPSTPTSTPAPVAPQPPSQQPVSAPSPAPATPPSTPPAPQPPGAAPAPQPVQPPSPSIRGSDSFDSTSLVHGDPFDGGEWRNARDGAASAVRVLATPVCVAGLALQGAGTDVDTAGSAIQIRLLGPSGAFTALDIRDAVVNRDFSPGPGGPVLPPQSRTFAPFLTTKIEVAMRGHGWFLLRGLKLSVVPCP